MNQLCNSRFQETLPSSNTKWFFRIEQAFLLSFLLSFYRIIYTSWRWDRTSLLACFSFEFFTVSFKPVQDGRPLFDQQRLLTCSARSFRRLAAPRLLVKQLARYVKLFEEGIGDGLGGEHVLVLRHPLEQVVVAGRLLQVAHGGGDEFPVGRPGRLLAPHVLGKKEQRMMFQSDKKLC